VTRLDRLKRRARAVAMSNGHVLGPFRRSDDHVLAACVRCEAFALVTDDRHATPIEGAALVTKCKGNKSTE
jgi:hypothetical protein